MVTYLVLLVSISAPDEIATTGLDIALADLVLA